MSEDAKPSVAPRTDAGLAKGTSEVPRLRPGITVAPGAAEAGEVWVSGNSRVLRLRGEAVRRIIAAIDGARTVDEVAREVGAACGDVAVVVQRLRRSGIIEPEGLPASGAVPAALARALADRGADLAALVGSMAAGQVAVVGGAALAASVRSALLRSGVGTVSDAGPPGAEEGYTDLEGAHAAVVALDEPDREALTRLNAVALARKLPWLLIEGRSTTLRMGPFFLPTQSACWTCYDRRLEGCDPAATYRRTAAAAVRRADLRPVPADNLTAGVAALAGELAALEVARFFAAETAPALAPSLWSAFADYDLWEHGAVYSRVLRLPRCPSCGPRARGLATVRAWMEPYGYPDED